MIKTIILSMMQITPVNTNNYMVTGDNGFSYNGFLNGINTPDVFNPGCPYERIKGVGVLGFIGKQIEGAKDVEVARGAYHSQSGQYSISIKVDGIALDKILVSNMYASTDIYHDWCFSL